MPFDKIVDSARLNGAMAATADAIREKTKGSDLLIWDDNRGFADAVGNIKTKGFVPPVEKDINFFDYEGTLLYSYTVAEAHELTELPPGPDWHDELVFYGWNWSLEGVKSVDYPIDVGALYTTDDDKARLHIQLDYPEQLNVTLNYWQAANYPVEVDWGDGSAVETRSGEGYAGLSHTYPSLGKYVIRVKNPGPADIMLGKSTDTDHMLGSLSNKMSLYILRKAYMGRTIRYGQSACRDNKCLEEATSCVAADSPVGKSAFLGTSSLKHFNFPTCYPYVGVYYAFQGSGVTNVISGEVNRIVQTNSLRDNAIRRFMCKRETCQLGENYGLYGAKFLQRTNIMAGVNGNNSGFEGCQSLKSVCILPNKAKVADGEYATCISLLELDFPATLTNIGARAFYNCLSLRRLAFASETPPTVANANAFQYIQSHCVVEVPAASLAEYQAATNYATIAAQMVGV